MVSSGCFGAHESVRDGGVDAGPALPPPASDIDLLFVIQSSNGIGDRTQHGLVEALPEFFRALSTGDHDGDGVAEARPFRSVHAGVITTDMGTGGFLVSTCADSDFGEDGILRTSGRADLAECLATYPAVLAYDADADAEDFSLDVGCVVNVGSGGCGFEQPLEAMLKAITPRAPQPWTAADFAVIGRPDAPSGLDRPFFRASAPHGDGANAGFLRDDSLLAVLLFADEDDCSGLDPEIFDPASATYADTDLSFRCTVHPEAYHPTERYVAGLLQLRRHPSHVAFLPLVGVPSDLEPPAGEPIAWDVLASDDPRLRDDRLELRMDPTLPGRVVPSCSTASGIAFPPVRVLRAARDLDAAGARVAIGSLCRDGYETAFASFLDALSR